VAEQAGHFFERHAREKVLDGKCVPQHVEMPWLGLAIAFLEEFRMLLGGLGQNLPEDLDPIRNLALAFASPAP